jgi:ribosomal subunit interface protein
MRITFKTKRVDLTDELIAYAHKRLSTCEKFLGTASETALCDVELAKPLQQNSGAVFYAEANLEANGTLHRATAKAETLEAAIDMIKHELQKELRRAKEKQQTSVQRGGAKAKKVLQGMK